MKKHPSKRRSSADAFNYVDVFAKLQDIKSKVSKRCSCLIANLLEAKANGWPKNNSDTPKTIEELHEDIAKEREREEIKSRYSSN